MNIKHRRATDRSRRQRVDRVPSSLRVAALLCAGAAALTTGRSLWAQFLIPNDNATPAVFVRDSAVAVEKFALAERMERLKEWDKAADVYQDLLKNYADKVFPLPAPKQPKFAEQQQYTSVSNEALARMEKWPAEAITIYRNRYEGEAAAALDAAHDDRGKLHHVMAQYFLTDAARGAATRLMQLYLEDGDFSAAANVGDEMLDHYPTLSDEQRPVFLFRTALAHHLAVEDDRAAVLLTELKTKFPQAHGNVRGEDVPLADALAKELAGGASSKVQSYISESWPIAFGEPDRARVPAVSNFGGARLFAVDIDRPTIHASFPQRTDLDRTISTQMAEGHLTGIFPVVDRGELFFQDNAHVYAVSLESGLPLTGWAQTYDGDQNGRYTLPNAWAMPISRESCLTVTDDCVLAVMGQFDLLSVDYTGQLGVRNSRLVCLDRETGQKRWIVSPRELPPDMAKIDFGGSPLVVGDTVYIQAHAGRGMQFEDFYVLAFDLATGKCKWISFVASANAPIDFSNALSDLGVIFGHTASHLAYWGGKVYALSNLGAVAAIDAYDGSVQWLDMYPREAQDYNRTFGFGRRGGWRGQQTIRREDYKKPWSSNPVIVSQGKVFVLPEDGLYIHVYDAASGMEVQRITRLPFDDADTMLGVVGEKLILNSDNKVFCVNWQNGKEPIWATPALQRSGAGGESIQGRGVVTAESVIVATAWQLYQISLSTGSITQTYPAGQAASWNEEEGPGNVLVTPDRLIIAGPTSSGQMRVNVYTDLTMAMAKLDAAVAAAPDDPAPRVRYAEVMYAGGKIDVAIAKLDEAMKLVADQGRSGRFDSVRDRIFNTAMTFAQKLAKANQPGQIELVSGLFERAGVAASSPSQKVNYRLSRAQYARQMNHPDIEVKLYQQILVDPPLRNVVVSSADGTIAAGDLARRQIAEVIGRAGDAVYAPFEKAAEEMLASASRNISPEQLGAVAQAYPNSAAAPRALLAAADIFETKGNFRAALTVLRQAALWYPSGDNAARIAEAMARNDLQLPDHLDTAISRLDQKALASQRLTRALLLPNGQRIENIAFSDAAAALRQYRATLGEKKLIDIGFPTDQRQPDPFAAENPNTTIADVEAMLVPAQKFSRSDRIVTFTSGMGLRVFAVGQNSPLLSSAEPFTAGSAAPSSCAWIGNNLIVWSSDTIACFGEGRNPLLWKTSIKSLPALELISRPTISGSDTSTPVQQPQQDLAGNLQIQIQGQGAVIIRGGRGGQVFIGPGGAVNFQPQGQLPAQATTPPPKTATEQIADVRVLEDRIIVGTTAGRLVAISLDGGTVLWQTRFADRAAKHLLASDDFVVAHSIEEEGTSAAIAVFDADSGQAISRTSFNSENWPMNLALAPDGMLIVITPSQIFGKDLFQPGGLDPSSRTFATVTSPADGSMPYQTAFSPEHLQLMEDQFVVVGVAPNGSSFIHLFDLHTGNLVKFYGQSDRITLDTRSSGPFLLRPFGSYLYVANQSEARLINLNGTAKAHTVDAHLGTFTITSLRDMVVTHNHLVLITDPTNPGAFSAPYLQLLAFSRVMQSSGMESGRLDFAPRLTSGTNVITCQLVDGGVYYLSGDHKLHYRQGAAVK